MSTRYMCELPKSAHSDDTSDETLMKRLTEILVSVSALYPPSSVGRITPIDLDTVQIHHDERLTRGTAQNAVNPSVSIQRSRNWLPATLHGIGRKAEWRE